MGREKGEAYLQKLAAQEIANSTASARALLDLVGAGEYAMAINIFNHHAVISAKKGAPVNWRPLEPVPSLLNTVGLPKEAPHPHAAMLFIDFLLSRKGQMVMQKANYLPAHPGIAAKTPELKPGRGRYSKATYMDPGMKMKKRNEWVDLYRKLFFK
jgi:iron(III) transport system substrate-binding protein